MLVSVVIPSYNHRQYVAQAIESVLDQSWPHVDLIVIDDGSKDGSPEVIQKLLDERGGFRFVARENRGLLLTLNEGLALARGEFFCELASDDYLSSDSIEKRVRFLFEHPECVAVFGDGFRVVNDAVVDQSFLDEGRRQVLLAPDPIPMMLEGDLPVFSTGLIRRHALMAIGGFDDQTFRYYEDLDTPILLALKGRLGFIDTQVIFRRQHDTNVSSSTSHVRVEKVLCYSKFLGESSFSPYRKLLLKRHRRSLLALGRHLSKAVNPSDREKTAFSAGWRYALRDVRLFGLLLKNHLRFFSQPKN
jgi:alpha-1,3-rhamnosyltransferase